MDDLERRRVPPVLGDEHDFAVRVLRDPRLHSIATWIEHELHESRITLDDAVRLGVYAVSQYLMRRGISYAIRVDDMTVVEKAEHGPCCRCRSCE